METNLIHSTDRADRGAASKQLREAADKLVGSVFYGTLLRQMRNSTLKGPYGHGGRGEEIFQAQLDQVFAEQAGKARSTRLSEGIVRVYGRQAERIAQWVARSDEVRPWKSAGLSRSSTASLRETVPPASTSQEANR